MEKLPTLTNLEDMRDYIETKFTSEVFTAKATTSDKFGPQVKWDIQWTPRGNRYEPCEGAIWASPDYLTSSVPFIR